MELRGRTALVTGGAVRIGRAIVQRLAVEGCKVVIHYNRSGPEAHVLRDELVADGADAYVVQAQLDNESACREMVGAAVEQAGPVSILVNNAAVFHKDSLMETTEEKLVSELSTNLVAPALLMRFVVEQARAAGITRGSIVNLLDRRIATQDPECLPYVLSKKGLAALTCSAAIELAPEFTVNGVAPGAILPPPDGSGMSDKAGERLLNEGGSPGRIAEAVAFLLAAEAITGQIVFVDGGQHLIM